MGSTNPGKQNAQPSAVAEPVETAAIELPADVLQLVANIKAVGAEQILYSLGGLRVEADKSEWDLGLGEWLLVRLPVGDRLADGRIWEV